MTEEQPALPAVKLAAVVLTRDVAGQITECLATLGFADLVVVSDSYSTDDTPAVAAAAGARVIQRVFDNFAGQRNAALDAVPAEWVFFVDSDERVSPALAMEVKGILAKQRPEAGWWVPRFNYIAGHLVRHGGFYPDYQLRLLRRSQARYDPSRPVHEVVKLEGEEGRLRNELLHYNYDSWRQFHAKQARYAVMESDALRARGIRPWPHKLIRQPLREFYRRYVTLEGFRDGWIGLKLAVLLAYYYGFLPHWYLLRRR